ncbi:MAG: hypothetical protein IT374_23505 [Polyangiaceae bacterium]|nr:hypothetical protein [Polyangiaceae bacterium]
MAARGWTMALALALGGAGCGMQAGFGTAPVMGTTAGTTLTRRGMDPEQGRPLPVAHEPCPADGAPRGDARAAVEGRELCRGIDVDGDGKPDLYVYFDPTGGLRRQERHGASGIEEVLRFEGGRLRQRVSDTNGDGKIDHWEHHVSGPTGDEIQHFWDLNGDGKVDQVWTWLPKRGCTTVHHDADGDGKPDGSQESCAPPAASSSR